MTEINKTETDTIETNLIESDSIETNNQNEKNSKSIIIKKICIILITIILTTALTGMFIILLILSKVYEAGASLEEYQKRYADINITSEKNGIIKLSSDNSDADSAILFYPGATVEYTAYIPLMATIAKEGYDVYIFEMPLNFALFSINKADEIVYNHPEIREWYIAGHSLGGYACSEYALKRQDYINGIILLGSTTQADLTGFDGTLLKIYGDHDGLIGDGFYNYVNNNPADTRILCIEGGNHAQFGDYGIQDKDGEATIDGDIQRDIASKAIIQWLNEQ